MNHEPAIKVLKEEIRGMKYFNKNAPIIASLEQSVKELEGDSLQEHKEVIRELMNTYIIELNEDFEPKASITDIIKLIDRAKSLI